MNVGATSHAVVRGAGGSGAADPQPNDPGAIAPDAGATTGNRIQDASKAWARRRGTSVPTPVYRNPTGPQARRGDLLYCFEPMTLLPKPPGDSIPLTRQPAQPPQRGHSCGTGPRVGGGCCGKDLGPMNDYEAPSQEDVERFSDVTRTCPECKGEVHDDAEICYHCGHVFGASPVMSVPPWVIAVASLVGLAMVYWIVF